MAGDLGTGLEMHALQPTTFENLWLVHDRLIIYDDKSVPQPQLAESWEVSNDAKQFKLNLRKGVQYHSGRDFTSDDVKYNIDRAKDPKVGFATFANQASWFNVETSDKYTAVLTSDAPRPLTWDFLEFFNMVDKETVEGPDGKTKLVGTGPFTFIEWVQGDHIELGKNKNYWQSGRPYLDGVHVNIARDTQAMVAQLEGGTVDAIKLPPLLDFNRLKADPRFQGLLHSNNGTFFDFAFNTSLPPMDNKQARQALAYSVDRQRIVDTVMLGVTKTQNLLFLPESPAFDPARANANAFDLDKARALLAQAGISSLVMDVLPLPGGAMEGNKAAEIWQADLAKLNITLNIKSMDFAGWVDQVTNRKYTGAYWTNNSRANLLPGTMLTSSPSFNPSLNNSGFKNDQYTDLVARSTSEVDPVKQQHIYSGLNDLLLDEVFMIPVSTYPLTLLATAQVRDISMKSYAGFGFTDAWLNNQI
jgi:peptide/nickel transport system substrate-binding protein